MQAKIGAQMMQIVWWGSATGYGFPAGRMKVICREFQVPPRCEVGRSKEVRHTSRGGKQSWPDALFIAIFLLRPTFTLNIVPVSLLKYLGSLASCVLPVIWYSVLCVKKCRPREVCRDPASGRPPYWEGFYLSMFVGRIWRESQIFIGRCAGEGKGPT